MRTENTNNKNRTHSVSVKLSASEYKALEAYSQEKGLFRAQVLRNAFLNQMKSEGFPITMEEQDASDDAE